jgi:hypothetical protein
MMLIGRQEGYALAEFDTEREQVLLWWHQVKTYSGAYAVVITDNSPEASGRWNPTTVEAVFEFGRQRSS